MCNIFYSVNFHSRFPFTFVWWNERLGSFSFFSNIIHSWCHQKISESSWISVKHFRKCLRCVYIVMWGWCHGKGRISWVWSVFFYSFSLLISLTRLRNWMKLTVRLKAAVTKKYPLKFYNVCDMMANGKDP